MASEVEDVSIELLEKLKQYNVVMRENLSDNMICMDKTLILLLTDVLSLLPPTPDTAALLATRLQGIIEYSITAFAINQQTEQDNNRKDSIGE